MEHFIPMGLVHLGVNKEARIAQLSNLFGQELHSLDRVAKYDTLVDLELGKECVETVDFLSLLHVGVVLCHTFQGQLVHQVDGVRRAQVFILHILISVHLFRSTQVTVTV